jgi:hypothetical protein
MSGGNVKIGAFGSGNDPVLKWSGAKTSQMMIQIEEGSVGSIIEDVVFDSIWPGPTSDRAGLPFAIKVNGNDSVVRGATFLNVSYGLQTNHKPTALLVQDSDAPSQFLRSYFLWGEGSDFVLLGNRVANVVHEHAIRIFGVNRILIAYNDLGNRRPTATSRPRTASTCSGPTTPTSTATRSATTTSSGRSAAATGWRGRPRG